MMLESMWTYKGSPTSGKSAALWALNDERPSATNTSADLKAIVLVIIGWGIGEGGVRPATNSGVGGVIVRQLMQKRLWRGLIRQYDLSYEKGRGGKTVLAKGEVGLPLTVTWCNEKPSMALRSRLNKAN